MINWGNYRVQKKSKNKQRKKKQASYIQLLPLAKSRVRGREKPACKGGGITKGG